MKQRRFKYTSFECKYEYLRVKYCTNTSTSTLSPEYEYKYMTLEIQLRVAHTATIGVIFVKQTVLCMFFHNTVSASCYCFDRY